MSETSSRKSRASAFDRDAPEQIGKYRILGSLAVGGMAEIFLGRRDGPEGFSRSLVIKRILPHLAKNESFVRMFLDEARIAAALRHPNVVSVEELNREGDELYMVMEYLAGEPLSGLMRSLAGVKRALDPMLSAYLVAEACAGLHAAHTMKGEDDEELGVVHRDVSPQNLFLTYNGSLKVLDFGIAHARDRLTKTESGYVKGKFDYMSPEQIQNEPLDRRSDIFALGIVLYEMLTMRRLFKRTNPGATLKAVLSHRIQPPSELREGIPRSLDRIVLRALSRQRRKRFVSAAAMRRELLAAIPNMGALPEERIKALMHQLFADRVAAKTEMLRRVRQGEPSVEVVREAESQTNDNMPAVRSDSIASPTTETRAIAGRKRSMSVLLIGLIAIVILASVIGVLVWNGNARPAETTSSTTTTSDVPSVVTINVVSSPPGATVHVPSGPDLVTPASLVMERSDEPVTIVFELDGYETQREEVRPDVDQRIRVQLTPVSPISDPDPPVATETGDEVTPTVRPRRRRVRRRTERPAESSDIPLWE